MKFFKNLKCIKALIVGLLFSSGSIVITSFYIVKSTNPLAITQTNQKKQTGKIVHHNNIQVTNSVNNIIIDKINISRNSSSAIVDNAGVQEIYVWGNNEYGQLGMKGDKLPFDNIRNPIKFNLDPFGMFDKIDINICNDQSFMSYAIVTTNNIQKLYTWGLNNAGQLGLNNTSNWNKPQKVLLGDDYDFDMEITNVICNNSNIFIIAKKDNKQLIFAAGDNQFGQLGDLSNNNSWKFIKIQSSKLDYYDSIIKFDHYDGTVHAVVKIGTELKLFVWGKNVNGELGLTTSKNINKPELHTNALFSSTNLAQMKLNFATSSYAWNQTTHDVYTWGDNKHGQLGLNSNDSTISTPTQLPKTDFNYDKIKQINVGISAYSLIEKDGVDKLYVWGNNTSGQLGLNKDLLKITAPVEFNLSIFSTPYTIKKISFANNKYSEQNHFIKNSFVWIESNNQSMVYVWGDNQYGQLGNNSTISSNQPIKLNLPSEAIIHDIQIADTTTVIFANNGNLETYGCGNNKNAQLGMGHNDSILTLKSILPPRSTYFEPTKNNYQWSSSDALFVLKNQFGFGTDYTDFNQYVKPINFLADTDLFIQNTSIADYINGTLQLNFKVSAYSPLCILPTPQSYTINIEGFRKVGNMVNKPVKVRDSIPTDLSLDNFFTSICSDDKNPEFVTNIDLLSKYIDLSAIPLKYYANNAWKDVTLRIEDKSLINNYKVQFSLITDLTYTNEGKSSFKRSKFENITISMPSYINWPLIIGLIVGGTAIIGCAIAIPLVVLKRNKKKNQTKNQTSTPEIVNNK